MAEGYVMTIPNSVLNKLTQADDKIKAIAKSSENTEKRVIESFKNMANGINPFIEKLNALKSLSNLKIDTALKASATSAEKTANSVAQVATQLNRVAESPLDVVNRKILSLKDLLDQSVSASQKMQAQMVAINQGGGIISKNTLTEGSAGTSLTTQIQAELKALELERNLLQQNEQYWKSYIENLTGSSIASQRQKAEMDKLNASFRNGNSLLQRQTRAEDEFGKAVGKAVSALDKAARAEERKNAARSNKEAQTAARAEEQYARALARSEATIVQRARKIEALTNAQRALTATGRDYTDRLARITSETQRLQKANNDAANSMDNLKRNQSKVLDISGQLVRQFALLFSVSAIKGYMDKLVAVRGEFELQQTALRSILQDKEKADEVWSKTVQLAVKSPFTVKELVTYTKQLAAYRIESDKLYETNKMLADVSAGLGVSMDRLILAFGQVKAANYLRASEVRQFTEAGVNILGELSSIYTELEGRMVSVAEVQERITKRMVKFGDVEEVFQRITSAGGIFYNMQEVQAETLAGMMSNLQDTFDLMFNEIGKANEGVLKDFVSLLRDIVNDWEKIAQIGVPIITILVSRWALLKGGMMLASLASSKFVKSTVGGLNLVSLSMMQTTAATERMTAMIKKSSGASVFGGWVTILSTVALIAWEIYNAISAIHESQRKMNRTISEGVQSATEMSQKFKILADTAVDSTKSVEDQKKALDELKRSYGDIVSAEQLTIENLQKMKGNYDAVTAAIYAKIEASTKEKLLAQVQDEEYANYLDNLEKVRKELIRLGVSSETARGIVSQLGKSLQEGDITLFKVGDASSLEGIRKELFKLIDTYTLLGDKAKKGGNYIKYYADKVLQSFTIYDSKLKDINNLNIEPLTFGDLPAAKEMDSLFNAVTTSVEKWKKDNQNKLSPFELSEGAKQKAIEGYRKFIKEIEDSLKGEGTIKIDDRSFIIASKFLEKADKSIEKIKGTTVQQEVARIIREAFQEVGANLDDSVQLMLGDEEGMKEYVKRFDQTLAYLKEQIDLFNSNPLLSPFGNDPKKMEEMRKQYEAMLLAEKKLPSYEKQKGTGESEADKRLKQQLSLLKEIGKEYEKNLKYYNKEDALAKTRADYASAAKEAGIGDLVMSMTFDPNGIISGIEEIGKQASKKMKLEIERSISNARGDVEVEVRAKDVERTKKQLEDLFAGYELSVELGNLGLPKDSISKLFNVNVNSLDQLKDKFKSIFPDVKKLSKEQLNVYNDFQKKITDAEQKEIEKRLKLFSDYLAKSVDKVKNVQNSGALNISIATDFFNKGKLDAEQYATVIKNITDEVNRDVSKINLQKFKETPEYIRAMGDLSAYSKSQLESLITKMREFISQSAGNLSASDLKVYSDAIDKIQNQLEKTKSPFSKNAFAEAAKIKKLQKEYNQELEKQDSLLKEQKQKEQELADAKQRAQEVQNDPNATKDDIAAAAEEVNVANDNLSETNNKLNISEGKLGNISGKMGQLTGGMSAAMGMADKIITGIYQSINATIDIMNQFKDLAESNGVDVSVGGWREAQQAGEILGNVNEKVMSSWNNFKSGNIAGAVADAVGSITTIFTTLNRQHDKRREQKIEKEIKLVNELTRAYEHLSRNIENAYTIDTLNASYENAQRNLEQQIESTQRMIAAEQDKKKKDDERTKEWQDELIKYEEQLEDLRNKKVKDLGGFGSGADMKSAAEEFTSAWMEAYMETGDGLDALNEKWDEFIQNIIVKQLALRGISKFLEPIMKQIDDAIGNDSYLSTDELAKIKENIEKLNPAMNDFLKDMMEGFGNLLPKPGSNNTELSGLSSSIQGVTEDTADIIAGYLNSIRFFVADSNMQLQTIALFFSADPAQNPMYSEMMAQTRLLRSIDDRLASVITSAGNHPLSGFAIKSII